MRFLGCRKLNVGFILGDRKDWRMKIGYSRVSTQDQSNDLQNDALLSAGCERIYEDCFSGKSKSRPGLEKMLGALRAGDTVIVWRLDRLGRSLKDLIELVESFREKEVQFISLTENISTETAMGGLVFHLFASIAEFERSLISERTRAGLEAARKRGRVGGRKAKLTSKQAKMAQAMLEDSSVTKTDVAGHFGVSRPTLNKALDALEVPDQCSLL